MGDNAPTERDELDEAAREGTLSAAEGTVPVPGEGVTVPPRGEVFIGEIPAAEDTTRMQLTVRCSEPSHDLLGHFETREEAESVKDDHLRAAH
jgi:hypothetical protein